MEEKRLSRVRLREEAFKLLFGLEFDEKKEEYAKQYAELNGVNHPEDIEYLKDIIVLLNNNKEYLETVIRENIKETWEYSRIAVASRALIKLAVIEIEYLEIPFKISINECINVSKKYNDFKNTKFINGVLASYVSKKGLGE